MINLSYELQSDILKYLTNNTLAQFYSCSKSLFILRIIQHIQCCTLTQNDKTKYPFYVSKIYSYTDIIPQTTKILIIKSMISILNFNTVSLTHIKFDVDVADNHKLPSTLTHVIFDGNYFGNIKKILPSSLKFLCFGDEFDNGINILKTLTPDLLFLKFGKTFNHTIDNLPNKIKYLYFGEYFNHPVNYLPESITHIKFGQCFNQRIDVLHSTIQYLTLSDIPLSVSLTLNTFLKKRNTPLKFHINFSNLFNTEIDNLKILYPAITHLTFSIYFNHPVDHLLSDNIIFLNFGFYFNQPINNLPSTVKTIIFNVKFNQPIDNLPSSVVRIIFRGYSEFNQPVLKLPSSLTYLKLSEQFNQSLDNIVAPSLLFLKFGECFNQPVNNLPSSLVRIIFDVDFNQCIDNLPSSIQYLTLGQSFTHDIKPFTFSLLSLTCYCTILSLGFWKLTHLQMMAKQDFSFKIPKTVKYLKIHKEYYHKIPRTVKYVYLL